jgi:hypothetical protein
MISPRPYFSQRIIITNYDDVPFTSGWNCVSEEKTCSVAAIGSEELPADLQLDERLHNRFGRIL